jgi:subfamily B ATP-binding cassette protein MsbA
LAAYFDFCTNSSADACFYLQKMTPKLREAGRTVQGSMGDMTQVAEEVAAGQRMVKIFAGAASEQKRFATAVAKNRHMQIRLSRISGFNSMVVEVSSCFLFGCCRLLFGW